MSRPRRQRSRGVGLLEALVALLVVGLGLLTYVGLQAHLRAAAELARQRTEALHRAQSDLEGLRTGPRDVPPDEPVPIPSAQRSVVRADGVDFTVTRTVRPMPAASGAAGVLQADREVDVEVDVGWRSRGSAQALVLRTLLGRADPRLSGALGLLPPALPGVPLARHPGVPVGAIDQGNGTSAFKPSPGGSLAWVLDNATAAVVRRCVGVTGAATVAAMAMAGVRCEAATAWLVSGHVQADPSDRPDPRRPAGPMPGGLSLRLDLDNSPPPPGALGWWRQTTVAYWPLVDGPAGRTIGDGRADYGPSECVVDRPVDPGAAGGVTLAGPLAYACAIAAADLDGQADTPPAFTARLTLWPGAGWVLGTGPKAWRVCRYTPDLDGDGVAFTVQGSALATIDNDEHPYAWVSASRSLAHQNFLLVRGDVTCPVAPAEPGAGHYTDATTAPHQP